MILPQIPFLDKVIKAKGKVYKVHQEKILMHLFHHHWIVMCKCKSNQEAQHLVTQLNQL